MKRLSRMIMNWGLGWGLLLGGVLAGQAAPALAVEPGENPLIPLWRDPSWVESFLNYDPGLAPRLSADEQVLYQELEKDERLQSAPLEMAARLESKIGPSSSALLSYVVATLYLREGNSTNAVRHLKEATEKNDRFLRAHKNLGVLLARDGQFEDAIPHLTRTVALGGGDSDTLGLLGYCHINLENHLSAQVAYQQAVLFDAANLDWRLGLIKCYVALGDYAPALDLLDELIERHPDRGSLWALQANVYVQLDRTREAIVNLEALRRIDQASVANLALLADLYMVQDSQDLALPVYLEVIEKDAGQDPTRAVRAAEILTSRAAWPEARQLMTKAREAYGTGLGAEAEFQLLKLEARVAMGSGEGEEGIRLLEEVVTRNPLDGEALLLAGDYYARNGQPEKAEFRYQTAARLEAFSADAWVKQAQLLVQSRKYPEAIELLRRAQKLKPRDHIQSFLERVQVAAERATRS